MVIIIMTFLEDLRMKTKFQVFVVAALTVFLYPRKENIKDVLLASNSAISKTLYFSLCISGKVRSMLANKSILLLNSDI